MSKTRREVRLTRGMREAANTVVVARRSLRRIGELIEARSKVVALGYGEDGLELYDRARLTPEDRLMNLRSARVWCARAENELQHLRALLDRAIDLAEGGTQ